MGNLLTDSPRIIMDKTWQKIVVLNVKEIISKIFKGSRKKIFLNSSFRKSIKRMGI